MTWSKPESRSIGLFTDLRLFSEALELASQHEYITKNYLMEELAQRVKGLLTVEKQSSRGIEDLIRESKSFGWLIQTKRGIKETAEFKYSITGSGKRVIKIYHESKQSFLKILTAKMHELYTIPGWFVHRLWTINPQGQGEVVIPIPPRNWSSPSMKWRDNKWTHNLKEQTVRGLTDINRVCKGSFPVKEDDWILQVKFAWERLSNLKQRKVSQTSGEKLPSEKRKIETYKPRLRLAMAMREAAVKLLFSSIPPNSKKSEFTTKKDPLAPRTYMAWCPRLEALALIFYTDVHPLIPGRLIFPTSVFRKDAPTKSFEPFDSIQTPDGEKLYLHRPSWESMRERFLRILEQEHQKAYARRGSLYVPLLDLRDEVCRQLRLSADDFDEFIGMLLRESLRSDSRMSISVETDIREDQRSAHRLIRRPVVINGTPHSLIAITGV